jgi:anti-anti-sigma regulatory factor
MLRITVHDRPEALTIQLEGRLAGSSVQVLHECWQNTLARPRQKNLCVDLTEVTSIDAAGRSYLATLHGEGVKFIASDCLTKDIVDEITRGPLHLSSAKEESQS